MKCRVPRDHGDEPLYETYQDNERGKEKMKILIIVLSLFLVSCTLLETMGDYVNENPVFVNIATNQTVGRYIEAAGPIDAQIRRAKDVQQRCEKVLAYVDGNPETTVDSLLLVIDSVIDWDKLSISDRLLVTDIVTLIELELRKYESQQPQLSQGASIAIRAIFKTAISAAQIYL